MLEFEWTDLPNPADYAFAGADKSHFCLLAHVGDAPAPDDDLPSLVRRDNNVAWKNVEVLGDAEEFEGYVSVGGVPDEYRYRLVFEVPEDDPGVGSVFEWGAVSVELGDELYGAWIDADGAFFAEQDGVLLPDAGSTVTLAYDGARRIRGLIMAPEDFFVIRIHVEPRLDEAEPQRSQMDVFNLDVLLYVEPEDGGEPSRLVGAQRIQLKTSIPYEFLYPPSPG